MCIRDRNVYLPIPIIRDNRVVKSLSIPIFRSNTFGERSIDTYRPKQYVWSKVYRYLSFEAIVFVSKSQWYIARTGMLWKLLSMGTCFKDRFWYYMSIRCWRYLLPATTSFKKCRSIPITSKNRPPVGIRRVRSAILIVLCVIIPQFLQ